MNENQPNTDGANTPPPSTDPPRDKKGQFQPKTPAPIQPNIPPEPVKPKITPTTNALYNEWETELKETLKDHPILTQLEGLDQELRIRMLRAVAKTVKPTEPKDLVDPLNTPPPIEFQYTPLCEENRADKFRADLAEQTSYLGRMNKIRGRK